jgi:hypothetical protein
MDVKAIMAMLTKRAIQWERFWWLRSLQAHFSCTGVDERNKAADCVAVSVRQSRPGVGIYKKSAQFMDSAISQ